MRQIRGFALIFVWQRTRGGTAYLISHTLQIHPRRVQLQLPIPTKQYILLKLEVYPSIPLDLTIKRMPLSETDQKFLEIAISEAQAGFDEGGIPIGACLVSRDGKLIAKGRNLRMQK